MSILIIATGFVLTGILIGLFATATAPVGYEDAQGFHFGNENGHPVPSRGQDRAHQLASSGSLTPRPA